MVLQREVGAGDFAKRPSELGSSFSELGASGLAKKSSKLKNTWSDLQPSLGASNLAKRPSELGISSWFQRQFGGSEPTMQPCTPVFESCRCELPLVIVQADLNPGHGKYRSGVSSKQRKWLSFRLGWHLIGVNCGWLVETDRFILQFSSYSYIFLHVGLTFEFTLAWNSSQLRFDKPTWKITGRSTSDSQAVFLRPLGAQAWVDVQVESRCCGFRIGIFCDSILDYIWIEK